MSFEQEFANYIGVEYCVGLASCLDSLWVGFRALCIGEGEEIVCLAKPKIGVYITKMIWKEMYEFSNGFVILCLASTHYDVNTLGIMKNIKRSK